MVMGGRRGQALVEFALVAPLLLLVIAGSVDLGRGMLLYGLLTGASRDTARQAVLFYNSGSNTLPANCTTLAIPCTLRPVVQGAHLLDVLGVSVVYADSNAIAAPPVYGTWVANANPQLPGTLTLTAATNNNTVYVFIYELDATAGNPNPRWSCRTAACINANGRSVRTTGHQQVVVDLQMRWRPVLARLLGLPVSITFNSQSVERIEY
jgi:Flp pilus assembly protein TadG